MAIALDGSVHGNNTASSLNVTLTTTNSNDIICVVATVNGGPVSSVTSTGLTFVRRASGGAGGLVCEFWTAVAASPLSTATITVTPTSASFTTVDAFGISGANTSTKFDSNGSLPATNPTGGVSITTSNANDMLLEMGRSGSATPSTDAGFTAISSADFQAVAYKVVSATTSGAALTIGGTNGMIGDAIVALVPPLFRRGLTPIGTRIGTRQTQVWGD